MEDYKNYKDLVGAIDDFIYNLRLGVDDIKRHGGENKIALSGQLDNVANELEEIVYEGYPRCAGCDEILKDEDKIFSFEGEEETYCKGCFEYEVEERYEMRKHGHPSLTDTQRNR